MPTQLVGPIVIGPSVSTVSASAATLDWGHNYQAWTMSGLSVPKHWRQMIHKSPGCGYSSRGSAAETLIHGGVSSRVVNSESKCRRIHSYTLDMPSIRSKRIRITLDLDTKTIAQTAQLPWRTSMDGCDLSFLPVIPPRNPWAVTRR